LIIRIIRFYGSFKSRFGRHGVVAGGGIKNHFGSLWVGLRISAQHLLNSLGKVRYFTLPAQYLLNSVWQGETFCPTGFTAVIEKKAMLPHDQIVNHIKPREESVDDRPEDRMVQTPGDRYCQRRTKADA